MIITPKVSYTPFISEEQNEFTIPESSYLDPIQLSDEIVRGITTETSEEQPNIPDTTSNLQWARQQTEQHTQQPALPNPQSSSITWTRGEASPVVSSDEIKNRQRYAESADNPRAVSPVGAKGLFQIMDGVHQDYVSATGDNGNLFDPIYNTKVRDWYWDWLGKQSVITSGNATDLVKTAKQLAAYNYGIGNLQKYLQKQQNKGVNINTSMDWINELSKETREYIDFILLGNKLGSRSEQAYKSRQA